MKSPRFPLFASDFLFLEGAELLCVDLVTLT